VHFLFPADPINPRAVDEYFKPQAEVLGLGGYSLFSLESQRVHGRMPSGERVMYRGWMLNSDDYLLLTRLVEKAGGAMLTTPQQYLNAHHIPNWYPLVSDFTSETVVFPLERLNSAGFDLVAELRNLGWEKFFLKDYVKSLKTARGALIDSAEDAPIVVALMEQFRGAIEGGLCVRKYEPGLRDEQRYFISNGEIRGVLNRESDMETLNSVAKRIDSPLFSVDIAYDSHGRTRLVEIGDGQVSDLVTGWTPERFKDCCAVLENV
jgi:hypothetical protein